MVVQEKIAYLQDKHFSEWLKARKEVEIEESDKQSMFCICGRLATGLHEMNCRKFRSKVDSATAKRLAHLIPAPKCEWIPCEEDAKHQDSSGDGRLVRVCTPHRRLLTKQKQLNNNV